ncbi:hypothetical protein ACFX12_022024 [Malus domestica]
MLENSVKMASELARSVIEHYANAGRTNDAFKVFLYMLETGVNPNAYTYTALTACFPSNLNFSFFVEFAKKYFVEILDKGLQPTPGTYFALVEKIDEGKDREEFVELVKAKGFMPTEADFRQGKELEDATKDTSDKEMQQIFKKMMLLQMRSTSIRKDALRMYHGLVKDGQVDEAKEIFKQTKEKGILLDVAIHTVVIEAYANAGKAEGALKAYKHMKYFLEMMDNGTWPNDDTLKAVIKGADSEDNEYMEFAKAVRARGSQICYKNTGKEEEDPEDIQEILHRLGCGIPVKAETYDMVIKRLAFQKPYPVAVKYARKYFLQMLDKGMEPDPPAYTFVMEPASWTIRRRGFDLENQKYFECHKHLEEAFDAYRMSNYATKTTDEETRKTFYRWRTDAAISMKQIMDMVEGMLVDGFKDEVKELFEPFFDIGVLPAIVTHTAVIEAYATAGKIKGAFEAYKHMSAVGIMPNCYTYSVFIKALATDPNFFGDAKKYWLEMMEKRMHPNAATYTAVFGGFARQGDRAVEDRSEFLRVMKSKGFVPDEEAVGEVLKGRTGEAVSCIMNILFGKYNL